MKKNKMMRLASGLLVAVLLTSSIVSGTFAKYVTSDSAKDSARVAKWGVVVATEGSTLFSKTYEKGNETVSSSTQDKLVAPGTKNEEGVTFTITGTPEVATAVNVEFVAKKDVFLKAGTYADYTTGATDDYFTFDNGTYYPVVFTLSNGNGTVLEQGNLSKIETYINGLSKTYAPKTDLSTIGINTDGTYKLTWAWDFDDNGVGTNDKKDTLLGNLAADPDLRAKFVDNRFYPMAVNQEYCNEVAFEITITVTQVD